MIRPSPRRLIESLFTRARRPIRREVRPPRPGAPPAVERLEDRVTPTTAVTFDTVSRTLTLTIGGANETATLGVSGTNLSVTSNSGGTTADAAAQGLGFAASKGAFVANVGSIAAAKDVRSIVVNGAASGTQNVTFAGGGTYTATTVNNTVENATFTTAASTFAAISPNATSGSLTVDVASLITIGRNVTTAGPAKTSNNQTYLDPVVLSSFVTLTGIANITFSSTVQSNFSGPFDLTVNTPGTTTFGGAVGDFSNPVDNLTTGGGGVTRINGGSVITAGDQTYHDDVVLGANTTLNTTAVTFTRDVTFNGRLDGGFDLSVFAGGATNFNGEVGGLTPLASVFTTAGGTTFLSGLIRTAGGQPYQDPVVLVADTTLVSTGAGAIDFSRTVDSETSVSPYALTVNTAGTTRFAEAVGGTNRLASLAVTNAAGSTAIDGGSVRTTGTQTYGGAVTLGANTTVSSTGSGASGNVTFASAVDGARTLAVNTAGASTFGGAVGGATPLTSVTTDSLGTTAVNAGLVRTAGAQTYADAVTLGADATFKASAVTFAKAMTAGARNLTVAADGISFNGGVGSVTGSRTVTLQPAAAAASIGVAGGAGTFQVTAAMLAALGNGFAGVVIGRPDGTGAITVNAVTFNVPVEIRAPAAGGTVVVNGTVTGADNASVTFTGAATLNANVVTRGGAITFRGPVTLGTPATVTLDTTNGGATPAGANIAFDAPATVNDNAAGTTALVLRSGTAGATTLAGAVGGTKAPLSLTTDAGGTTALLAGVTTTGTQTYADAITLGADVTLSAPTATFPSSLDLGTRSLTVTGNLSLAGSSTLVVRLASPTAHGRAAVSGKAALNGSALAVVGGFPLRPGAGNVGVLTAGSVDGGFAGLAEGARVGVGGETFTVSYGGGKVTLIPIPRPVVPPPPPGPNPPPPPLPPAVLVGTQHFAAATDAGGGMVRMFDQAGTELFSVNPFPGFAGGVRVAAADFSKDGTPDLLAGTGPGAASQVRVLGGTTRAELFALAPFEPSFLGGVFVAAGDVTGDGVPDLIVTPDQGGGPRVRIFSGDGFAPVADFLGIDDPNFRGGARAAVADVNGDGVGDLIVAAGFGGGPRIAIFDGRTLATGPVKLVGDFLAFPGADAVNLRNGVFVAAGDMDGDGKADPVFGGGPGGGPRVFALSGAELMRGNTTQLANFFAGDVANRGGLRVAVKDLDNDRRADLVASSGQGAGSQVTAYLGKDVPTDGAPPAAQSFESFAGFQGGVYIG